EGALVVPLDAQRRPFPHASRFIPCDLICLSTDRTPTAALVAQSGGELGYDEALGQTVPQQLPSQVLCAGDVTGIHHLPATLVQGRLAGLRAAHSLRASETSAASSLQTLQHECETLEQEYRRHYEPYPHLSHAWTDKKQFVCVCEDITHKDLAQGVAEGFDEVETLKRYSTFSMGPCQGRMCATSSARICARYAGAELATRTTTARPPVTPVPLGVLAGRGHQPEKHTPLHQRHIALG
ncbi:MAG: (2Fe-2S)-binding protein, partial [Gemmatimonadetes bacterium]|nr:(2Fe-2S)-binding protein [Gemmatimonadota bacterium]